MPITFSAPSFGLWCCAKIGSLKEEPKGPHPCPRGSTWDTSIVRVCCLPTAHATRTASDAASGTSRCGASWWDHRCSIAVVVRQDWPKKPAIKWGYNLTPLKLGVHPLPCQSSQPFWMKHKSCIYILLYNILYTLIFCHICKYIYILNNIDIVQYIYISNKQKNMLTI